MTMNVLGRRAVLPMLCLAVQSVSGQPSDLAARNDLCVTNGTIEATAGGYSRIDTASSRAVAPLSDGRAAAVHFRYLGSSTNDKPLASGELRRQIGLKLKAENTCNLIYATWHIEPDNKIAVSVKRNAGQNRNEQCHANGYVTIQPLDAMPVPPLRPGVWHDLRADLHGLELTVHADGIVAWHGLLPPSSEEIDGPAGMRTDNARFEFQFFARAGQTRSGDRCQIGTGD
jgi:hypothetical protein